MNELSVDHTVQHVMDILNRNARIPHCNCLYMLKTYSVLFNFKIYYYFYLMMVWLRISLLIQFLSEKSKLFIYLFIYLLYII